MLPTPLPGPGEPAATSQGLTGASASGSGALPGTFDATHTGSQVPVIKHLSRGSLGLPNASALGLGEQVGPGEPTCWPVEGMDSTGSRRPILPGATARLELTWSRGTW